MATYQITPIGKPRMTKADAWKKRPAVLRYWQFKDAVRDLKINIPQPAKIVFTLPMPGSWSKVKRARLEGCPHQQTPDLDNLLKALLDAVFDQDSQVWKVHAEKRWGLTGEIEVEAI